MILINKRNKIIERFEPYGMYNWDPRNIIDKIIMREVVNKLDGYLYIKPLDYCPVDGPQKINRDEYCVVWSTLYAELRIKKPELTRGEIAEYMIDIAKDDPDYIARYKTYIQNTLEEYPYYRII